MHFPREVKGCYYGDPGRGMCWLCYLRLCWSVVMLRFRR